MPDRGPHSPGAPSPDVPSPGGPPPASSGQAVQTGLVAVAALVFVVGGLVWAYHRARQGGTQPASTPQRTPPGPLAPAPGSGLGEQARTRPDGPTFTPPPDPGVIEQGPWPSVLQALQGPAPSPLALRVNKAIDRGLSHLRQPVGPSNVALLRQDWCDPKEYRNYLGLLGLTLLECDVPRNDPGVRRIAELVRSQRDLAATYELSLAILFLDRLGDPNDGGLIRTFARRLLAGQDEWGAWSYTCYPQPASPAARDTPPRRPSPWGSDNSNTQFAVLGLWVAQRHGVPVGRALRSNARHFRESQGDDGSWTYRTSGTSSRHAMTCAALFCLAAEQGASPGYTRDIRSGGPTVVRDPAITRGLRFLGKACDTIADGGAIDAWDWLYFLWSLERVAAIYGLETIGSREWYPWAADLIVRRQSDSDGSWSAGGPAPFPVPTCFALLVLRRSNLAPDLAISVPGLSRPGKAPSPGSATLRPDTSVKPPASRVPTPDAGLRTKQG